MESVLCDRDLSSTAFRVFCELAIWAQKGSPFVSRGQRAIGERLGMHQQTVLLALRELAGRRHIRIIAGDRGQRSSYELLSPVYGARAMRRKKAA